MSNKLGDRELAELKIPCDVASSFSSFIMVDIVWWRSFVARLSLRGS